MAVAAHLGRKRCQDFPFEVDPVQAGPWTSRGGAAFMLKTDVFLSQNVSVVPVVHIKDLA